MQGSLEEDLAALRKLREDDAIGSLNLADKCLGVIEAELLGLMLPAATSLRELR